MSRVYNDGTGDGIRAIDGSSKARKGDLTQEARTGYMGNENPHLYSSPCWYAHSLGQYLHATGRAVPDAVRMSRGSKMRCRDSIYEYQHGAGRECWERVS